MLVLSRQRNERVVFPSLDITVEVLEIRGDRVRLGFQAPASVSIFRGELASDAGIDVADASQTAAPWPQATARRPEPGGAGIAKLVG